MIWCPFNADTGSQQILVYSEGLEPSKARLSGPGRRLDLIDKIKVDGSDAKSPTIGINLMGICFGNRAGASLAYGFPFHEACWGVLTDSWSPCDREIQFMFDLCRSTPIEPSEPWGHNQAILDWGHAYGGVYRYPLASEELTLGMLSDHINADGCSLPSLTSYNPLRHDSKLTLAI